MKRILLALLLFVASAHAAPISLVLDDVPLVDLAKLVYGEVANLPYVLTHEAAQAKQKITLALRNLEQEQIIKQVDALLAKSGYKAETREGIVWIDVQDKKPEDAESEMIYRPRYRSVSYLQDPLAPLFKPGAFGHQRALSNQASTMQPQAAPGAQQGQKAQQQPYAQQQPRDSGTSVYSMFDKSPDVLVFKGTERDKARLQTLLGQLDIPIPEVMVKAVVYEVSVDGVEKSALSIVANILGGKIGLNVGQINAGDYSAVFKAGGIQVVFDALNSDRRFKVVSSPSMRVQSGATARLTVGSETPVLGNAQTDKNGNPVQSVEYRPAGVILDLKPQLREEVADLQITQQISNFIPTTSGVNGSPTLLKRELSTSVGVRSGDVLVLGGLDEERKTDENAGLPFLPDWLTSKSRQSQKSEILLIMQAQRIE